MDVRCSLLAAVYWNVGGQIIMHHTLRNLLFSLVATTVFAVVSLQGLQFSTTDKYDEIAERIIEQPE
jgi:hypothetical protein